jgi:hypothetical protein
MLGIGYDTAAFVVFLPDDKLAKLRERVLDDFPPSRKTATVKDLQRLVGYLRFITMVVPSGRFFLRRFIAAFADRPPHHRAKLTPEFFSDIAWWQAVVAAALRSGTRVECPIELHVLRPRSAVAFSDASGHGLGGYSPDLKFWWSVPLPAEVAAAVQTHQVTINSLEMIGMLINAFIGVSLQRLARAAVYQLFGDNRAAVSWISSGAASPLANDLARHLGELEFRHGVTFSASHVAGTSNGLADRLSRESFDTPAALASLPLPSDWLRQVPPHHLLCHFYQSCLSSSPNRQWRSLL